MDAQALAAGIMPPTDASNTVTGAPPYRVTVSFTDPEVGEVRHSLGAPVDSGVLAATNDLPIGTSARPAAKPV